MRWSDDTLDDAQPGDRKISLALPEREQCCSRSVFVVCDSMGQELNYQNGRENSVPVIAVEAISPISLLYTHVAIADQ